MGVREEYNDFASIRGNISPHMFYMNETCEQELHEARLRIDELTKKEETLNQDINKNRGSISDMERQLHDTKATMEKNLRDYDALLKKSQKVTEDLESQVQRNKELHGDCMELEKDLKHTHVENRRLLTENDILERKFDKEHKDVVQCQKMLEEAKTPLLLAQVEIESLKKALSMAHHKETVLERENETVAREKDIQIKAKQRVELRVKEQLDVRSQQ